MDFLEGLKEDVVKLRNFYGELRGTNVRSRGLKVSVHERWCWELNAIVDSVDLNMKTIEEKVDEMGENIKFLRTQISQPKRGKKKKEESLLEEHSEEIGIET
jgi:hypothetical protein